MFSLGIPAAEKRSVRGIPPTKQPYIHTSETAFRYADPGSLREILDLEGLEPLEGDYKVALESAGPQGGMESLGVAIELLIPSSSYRNFEV